MKVVVISSLCNKSTCYLNNFSICFSAQLSSVSRARIGNFFLPQVLVINNKLSFEFAPST